MDRGVVVMLVMVGLLAAHVYAPPPDVPARQVTPHYFDSEVLPPAARVPAGVDELLASLNLVSEGQLVHMALNFQPKLLGLEPGEVREVSRHLIDVYGKIADDPIMAQAASALPFCLAGRRPTRGHYFLYTPEKIDENTPLIVFLHGLGGNFQYYAWKMAHAFPDAVIVLPSWTNSWQNGRGRYLFDAVAHAQDQLEVDLPRPWLIGLSDGGEGAMRIYRHTPEQFEGLVLISSMPRPRDLHQLDGEPILMLHGREDRRFALDRVEHRVERSVDNGQVELAVLPGGHFMMLTHGPACFELIREHMADDPPTQP